MRSTSSDVLVISWLMLCAGCSSSIDDDSSNASGSGGASDASGGAMTGTGGAMVATGGNGPESGGAGATSTGGAGVGGGGAGSGGTSSGGTSSGGTNSGGTGSGGDGAGGTETGGAGTGGSATSDTSAGCGTTPGITSDQYNNGQPISIMAGGMQRRYILSVPENYDNTHPYRLVVSYHQLDGNDIQNYNWQFYGLRPLAGDTTIFVAPNGQKNGSPCSAMSDGDGGCGWPNTGDQDVALADAVVAEMKENFCIDTNRVFATGWSFGGAMSYQTACARPLGSDGGYIRGVAVYSGSSFIAAGPCPPQEQVAYFAHHGTNDGVLGYDGGVSMAQDFANVNGCSWSTPERANGNHVCTDISGCDEGYPVRFCSHVGDHTPFPDGGDSNNTWGPEEAWNFLSQF